MSLSFEHEEIGNKEIGLDASLIDIDSSQVTVLELVERMQNNAIVFSQMETRENNELLQLKDCQLLESLILGVPFSPCFFDIHIQRTKEHAEENKSAEVWYLVKGIQCLSSIRAFVLENGVLHGMEFLKTLENSTFNMLPVSVRRRFLESKVLAYFIKATTPEEIKFNLFRRINANEQSSHLVEIRNAIFHGTGTSFIEGLTFESELDYVLGKNREDAQKIELVNRVIAFYLMEAEESYSSMDLFLNDALRLLNHASSKEFDDIKHRYAYAIRIVVERLGENAFRRFLPERKRWSQKLNSSLFETMLSEIMRINDSQRQKIGAIPNFEEKFKTLFFDKSGFVSCIMQSTWEREKVIQRHNMMKNFISDLLKNDD